MKGYSAKKPRKKEWMSQIVRIGPCALGTTWIYSLGIVPQVPMSLYAQCDNVMVVKHLTLQLFFWHIFKLSQVSVKLRIFQGSNALVCRSFWPPRFWVPALRSTPSTKF